MSSEAPKKRGRKPGSTNKPTGPVGSRASSVRRNVTLDDYPAIQVEGGLFTVEHVRKVAKTDADKQSPADYDLPAGIDLKEEIGRSFRIATALWKDFDSARQGEGDKSQATVRFVSQLLKDCFGFADIKPTEPKVIAEIPYPIGRTAHGKAVPVLIVGAHQGLDVADLALGDGHRKRTASQLAQEYLNAEDACLWAVCTNGLVIRLLRDSDSLTRQSYFEANIERILGEQLMADFAMLWLHAHASRLKPDVTGPAGCPLEIWHLAAQEEGSRVRDSLRIGVENAMVELGSGFLEHRDGARLREALRSGTLKLEEYHQQVLRLVYRMLFLFAVEDRKILHPRTSKTEQVELYAEGYSLSRLRERSIKHCHDRYDDIWDSLKVTFKGLATGQEALGLPPLGSLFAEEQCAELVKNNISNRRLLNAVRAIAWFRENDALVPVSYKSMGTEELGSVYESLLELVPCLEPLASGFSFVKPKTIKAKGNKKKTSGSYYTPDSLVQLLLESTLVPVLNSRLKGCATGEAKEAAILAIKVLDPACGSGHFLLGAARKLAEVLARVRSASGEPTNYHRALQDVILNCIHGVDRNPMAIELAKVALWLEGYVADRPLSFLDANLVTGDSILSIVDLDMAKSPIWAKAFEPNEGEDSEVCRQLSKRNKSGAEQIQKGGLALFNGMKVDFTDAYKGVESNREFTLEGMGKKSKALMRYREEAQKDERVIISQMYLAAYAGKKVTGMPIPTTNEIFAYLNGESCEPYVEFSRKSCEQARAIIWPIAFPAVFSRGGFDVVLANPPWDRVALEEEEFFANRIPSIASASNQGERRRMIEGLATSAPGSIEAKHFEDYVESKRLMDAMSQFAHDPARYPLTGRGIVNLYALFSENAALLINKNGRAGLITPTGLVTDGNTSEFFSKLVSDGKIASIYDFENRGKLFASVDSRFKFCLTSIGYSEYSECAFMLHDVEDLKDPRRVVKLRAADFALVNPNTKTTPVVRSSKDLEMVKSVYERLPVLLSRNAKGEIIGNPWSVELFQLFNMSTNSKDFVKLPQEGYVRLYESKMFHHYDHRWSTFPVDYWSTSDDRDEEDEIDEFISEERANVSASEKKDPNFIVRPRYWAPEKLTLSKLAQLPEKLCKAYRTGINLESLLGQFVSAIAQRDGYTESQFQSSCVWFTRGKSYFESASDGLGLISATTVTIDDLRNSVFPFSSYQSAANELFRICQPKWLIAWRKISNTTNSRTLITTVLPTSAAGDSAMFIGSSVKADLRLCLAAYLASIPLDYIVRSKLGGTNITYNYMEQIPVLDPSRLSATHIDFILPRALELFCTAVDMKLVYEDVVQAYSSGKNIFGSFNPYSFEPERRAKIRGELDAYFAYLMGYTRDELAYILDPKSFALDHPSETFRSLRDSEVREYGEYRTQRLVLEGWDRIVEPLRRGQA